ncbi:MAG: aminotransferase class I/II-fold pyridoxal phosphate-dependent enzyme, partial [Saprospiraceae bacterium]|nr:aminotransferase class I/II-fold pyridoxal phosphate-dependent enzyme [Saprospiraceae bacterium]
MRESVIPFNIPTHLSRRTTSEVLNQYLHGQVEEDQCDHLVKKLFGSHAFLTKSCTHSLEVIAKLIGFNGAEEVIMPAYAFPSLATAFITAGAKLVFADSGLNHPNVDVHEIERLITPKTKALVVLHYGGCACDMEKIQGLTRKHNIILVEDAA